MAKVEQLKNPDGDLTNSWTFLCPACKNYHVLDERWTFNGDLEKPTFNPSLRVMNGKTQATLCHLFIKNGKIEYLGDCPHDYKNKTIEMVDIKE